MMYIQKIKEEKYLFSYLLLRMLIIYNSDKNDLYAMYSGKIIFIAPFCIIML